MKKICRTVLMLRHNKPHIIIILAEESVIRRFKGISGAFCSAAGKYHYRPEKGF